MDSKNYIIESVLEENGDNRSPTFYMNVIWKEAQKELLQEIKDNWDKYDDIYDRIIIKRLKELEE